jgi:oxygen-independent coproporphyrinogen-3 oxidase
MAGIYVHIPFCRHKCGYCNFFSVASLRKKDSLVRAIIQEARQKAVHFSGQIISTLYLGGGTPSMLSDADLFHILRTLQSEYSISADAEISLEVNPDDIGPERLYTWKEMGWNRLSIGIQSWHPDDLTFLERKHNQAQARKAVCQCKEAGFEDLSVDLIYGIPGQDLDRWRDNLAFFLETNVHHLSAYALTLEERTAYAHQVEKGRQQPPDDEAAFGHFCLLQEMMSEAGFLQYEVSNFARKEAYSRHNRAYWEGVPYLGLGPSAHSYDGSKRAWNVSGIQSYLDGIEEGDATEGFEMLQPADKVNEYLMTALRTIWGCRFKELIRLGGQGLLEETAGKIEPYILNGWALQKDDAWVLSREGLFHADGIAAELFVSSSWSEQ